MATSSMSKVVVVVPNWNGVSDLPACLDSLQAQRLQAHIIVVDNGSVDKSVQLIEDRYSAVEIIRHSYNKGYAGGVNPGFRRAIELHADYVAPFNNDAIADKNWLYHLVTYLDKHPNIGVVAPKLVDIDETHLDTTGEGYSIWGLPFPRGRGETNLAAYDNSIDIIGASGGSSLYRVAMLEKIGLLDEDFFAYYEDVDLSLRAQLAGWKIAFVPSAVVRHQISATGRRVKGFFTLQTLKNLPWILVKDMPASLFWRVLPRFLLAQTLFIGRAVSRGQGWYALKAVVISCWFLPKKVAERHQIQSTRKVTPEYIWSMMTHDLPPEAHNLRELRQRWRKLWGRV